ncbi:alpha/beta hydrolase [Pseudorhodobacter ferrugineus]|uniref:alpha/beta hydrolase n=1 Tax=Pseudorhodobacter ferrugineus TaxID=77008 RepID=UPI0003B3717F|nr:carboxylesterase family protein [Pseudorhodobacter ferrugineus]
MRVLEGLCFAPEHRLVLDAYCPTGPARAVVLYLHGGGFLKGSRNEPMVHDLAKRLIPQGVAVVSPDYRLRTGLAAFSVQDAKQIAAMQARSKAIGLTLAARLCGPAMIAAMRDIGAAMAALQAGLVPEVAGLPMVCVGVSAGGIASLSLAYPPPHETLPRPDAVLSIAGAMVQPWRLAPNGPPCVMLHGSKDRVIGPENPRFAAQRAQGQGADLHLIETGIEGHNPQISAFLNGVDAQGQPYFDLLTSLLAQVTATHKPASDWTDAP